jgi:flagellar motor switch protein FliN/FliY
MNPAEIDALVASVQAAKATGQTPAAASSAAAAPAAAPAESAATPMPPQLAEFERIAGSNPEVPLSMLFSLSLPISIELGRTAMSVQEILRLGRGSVIQLDRLAGEPIDIFVGDRRFAEGEVVVLGEHFGVRVTRILARGAASAPRSKEAA